MLQVWSCSHRADECKAGNTFAVVANLDAPWRLVCHMPPLLLLLFKLLPTLCNPHSLRLWLLLGSPNPSSYPAAGNPGPPSPPENMPRINASQSSPVKPAMVSPIQEDEFGDWSIIARRRQQSLRRGGSNVPSHFSLVNPAHKANSNSIEAPQGFIRLQLLATSCWGSTSNKSNNI